LFFFMALIASKAHATERCGKFTHCDIIWQYLLFIIKTSSCPQFIIKTVTVSMVYYTNKPLDELKQIVWYVSLSFLNSKAFSNLCYFVVFSKYIPTVRKKIIADNIVPHCTVTSIYIQIEKGWIHKFRIGKHSWISI
jgi:hypothetical protein